MEASVMQLEAGNHEADDSEIRQKYENQRQLNVQLQEQVWRRKSFAHEK